MEVEDSLNEYLESRGSAKSRAADEGDMQTIRFYSISDIKNYKKDHLSVFKRTNFLISMLSARQAFLLLVFLPKNVLREDFLPAGAPSLRALHDLIS